ncbi:hypothetical protein M758_1G216600 [Ceratodon purpureus]|uniref:Uncharacterized protein n=1 Tax=Ceratodon purpureus TaxID=3225 RepID=A0A8T0JAF3_CERPU|nr:hypothetical protein KC19_1G203700 [Ceratodon purpureus]KAG0630960.1 hypothetical protein M758_1G216600 [Ceratodon purpureus]
MSGVALLRAGWRQAYSRAAIYPSSHLSNALGQQRWATQISPNYKGLNRPAHAEDEKPSEKVAPVIYEGVMADTLRRVKILSLTTCCLSVVGGPFVTFFTSPDLSVIAKGAMASIMVLLSATTTGALHWFASPYVRRLSWTPGTDQMQIEVLSWMATPLQRSVNISDVRTPVTQRPAVTFEANGQLYYIDKDAFPHAELLKKLARK